jgi:hypothetical protein
MSVKLNESKKYRLTQQEGIRKATPKYMLK